MRGRVDEKRRNRRKGKGKERREGVNLTKFIRF
jgi:hypothetical protein